MDTDKIVRGEPVAVYMVSDKDPGEGWVHVITMPKCAFQVAEKKPASSLWKRKGKR